MQNICRKNVMKIIWRLLLQKKLKWIEKKEKSQVKFQKWRKIQSKIFTVGEFMANKPADGGVIHIGWADGT